MGIKIIGIAPCYNELSSGHLPRFLSNVPNVLDGLIIMDDASIDGTTKYLKNNVEHVIYNKANSFLFENKNTQILIDEALKLYPDLTHIMTLNIDCTFSRKCIEDKGDSIKAILDSNPEVGMWCARNVHLWRSPFYHRVDNYWGHDITERVYVRKHSLTMLNSNTKGLHRSKVTTAPKNTWKDLSTFNNELFTFHWGFSSKKLISNKFHYYMKKEPQKVPNPSMFLHENVFKLLNEYDAVFSKIEDNSHYNLSEVDLLFSKKKPKPISYYMDIREYDARKAEEYKKYFISKLGYYNELDEYEEF